MKYVMRLIGLASGQPSAEDGLLVKRYDPEFDSGLGRVWSTNDQRDALAFDSMADAMALYQSVSRRRPVRYDGRPNKPLTAYTIEIEPLEAANG